MIIDSLTLTKPPIVARAALAAYTFLIVYASLYPFSGWRDLGVSPWGFLSAPLPYYWTKFDALTNVAGYLPFGVLAVLALYPRVRGLAAVVLAILAGALLSGAMEVIQTFLPSRVPSNLDLFTNLAGTVCGAPMGWWLARPLLQESWLLRLRDAWFTPAASRGMIVMGLWPLAQIYPQTYLLGHGQFLPILSGWLSTLLEQPIDLSGLLIRAEELSAQQYWLAETIITACGMTGALLTGACLLRAQAPRLRLMLCLLLAALAIKSLACAVIFDPHSAFDWLTPGAQGGLLFGAMMLAGLVSAPPRAQRRVAAISLLLSLIVVNAVPDNPYFAATMQTWTQGKFLNFSGAAQFLALAWSGIALWFLLHPVHRARTPPAEQT